MQGSSSASATQHDALTITAGDSRAADFEACCRALNHNANKTIVEQLPILRNGEVVDLSRNYVGAAGLQAIAVVLPQNPNVKEVRAPRNGITNDAVVLFCRAMRGHHRLTFLDFSENVDVSLAAGLALLTLAQQTPSLRTIHLDGTHVPAAVLNKLRRALEYNATRKATPARVPSAAVHEAAAPAAATAAAVIQRTKSSAMHAAAEVTEKAALQSLQEKVASAVREGYKLSPPSPNTGWRVLEVPILAPPLLFDTEIEILCDQVFPRLNREFFRYQLILHPIVVCEDTDASAREREATAATNGGTLSSEVLRRRTAGSYNNTLFFRPASDVMTVVKRARFAVIELVGDRPGDYAQLPASAMLHLQTKARPSSRGNGSYDLREDNEAEQPSDDNGTALLQPVLYEAHEVALRRTQWLLVATRRGTRTLQVPAALAPLLTADPSIAHPDRHRGVVRAIVVNDCRPVPYTAAALTRSVATSTSAVLPNEGVPFPTSLEWDYNTEEYQWRRHVAWQEHVVATAPIQELVVPQYVAAFDCTDAKGGVRLNHLEGFRDAMYARLRTIVETCTTFHETEGATEQAVTVEAPDSVGPLLRGVAVQRSRDTIFFQELAAVSSGAAKKNLMNRMILYAANPPSRNLLLLHGTDPVSLASLMARGSTRLQALQHAYTLTSYSTRTTLLHEEPTDIRSAMTHITSQLTTDAAVLRYVNAEVDVERLSVFFQQLLSGAVASKTGRKPSRATTISDAAVSAMREAGLPEYVNEYVLGGAESIPNGDSIAQAKSHAFVVMLDGLEEFTMPVQPCGALVCAPGSDSSRGGGAEAASWSTGPITMTSSANSATSSYQSKAHWTPLESLLPRALARDVRLIASCDSKSPSFSAFRHLGRDSVEMLSLGTASANEVEQYLSPASLARLGLVLSEDEFECARSKRDAPIAEYMRYLLDAARSVHEAPGFLTQRQTIEAFPHTLEEAAQGVYDRLVRSFGLALTRHVLGLLTASRWGLLLPELRELLPQLSPCRFEELLRLLRPTLEDGPSGAAELLSRDSGNVLLGVIRVAAPSFLEVVQQEFLQHVTDELQLEDDHRVWHAQLAQYFLAIVYRSLRPSSDASEVFEGHCVSRTLSDEADVPSASQALQRRAMKEVLFHMTQSGSFWAQIDITILSIQFLEKVYETGLGYAFLRDLTKSFNERYQQHLLGEDVGEPSWQQRLNERGGSQEGEMEMKEQVGSVSSGMAAHRSLPAVLKRMRDYICFAHQYGLLLSLRPSLVAQTALQIPADLLNAVQRDAVTYLYRQLQDNGFGGTSKNPFARIFFTPLVSGSLMGAGKKSPHLRSITCTTFLPNRKFVVSGSKDRSLAWVNPETGLVAWHARQPTAAIESLTVCCTSAYVAAVSEDRTIWIYDGQHGTVVSQFRGSEWFDSPIASVTFSARGRYLWVVTTDTRVRCFACETGQLRCAMGPSEMLRTTASCSANGVVDAGDKKTASEAAEWRQRRQYLHVLVDAEDDEACTTVLANELRQWRLHPWDEPLSTSKEETKNDAPRNRVGIIVSDLTGGCRLSEAAISADANTGGHPGFKLIKFWEPAGAGSSETCVLAVPLTGSEVHLFALRHGGTKSVAAVRFSLPAAPSSSATATAANDIAQMCISPDRHWLALGTTNGLVSLFYISDAYRGWTQTNTSPVICRPTRVYTTLMPIPGFSSLPLCSMVFHRDSKFLFALGRFLACWRLPSFSEKASEEVYLAGDGEYKWTNTPTCLTVLPPPTTVGGDAELPSTIAEIAVGDDTGSLTLLKLWQQLM